MFVTENVDDNTFMIQFISVNEILNFKDEHEHQNIHEVITTYYEYVNNFYNCNFKDSCWSKESLYVNHFNVDFESINKYFPILFCCDEKIENCLPYLKVFRMYLYDAINLWYYDKLTMEDKKKFGQYKILKLIN